MCSNKEIDVVLDDECRCDGCGKGCGGCEEECVCCSCHGKGGEKTSPVDGCWNCCDKPVVIDQSDEQDSEFLEEEKTTELPRDVLNNAKTALPNLFHILLQERHLASLEFLGNALGKNSEWVLAKLINVVLEEVGQVCEDYDALLKKLQK